MPKLGVVTCQILELEFAHILSRDPSKGFVLSSSPFSHIFNISFVAANAIASVSLIVFSSPCI